MSVVIAGCGDLGTEIGLRLAGQGHEVLGLRRRAEQLPPPLTGSVPRRKAVRASAGCARCA